MQELTTVNILSIFETTKDQRKSFAEDIVNRLRNGEADPLKVHVQVKAMEEIIKTITDKSEKTNKNFTLAIDYNTMLLDAAEKNGKKFQMFNAEFSVKEVGTVYNWEQCNDPELAELLSIHESTKEKIKQNF